MNIIAASHFICDLLLLLLLLLLGIQTNDVVFRSILVGKIKVGISGPIGAKPASPRELTSASLRQLVCVEGVATKVSTIKPKVVKSSHYCPETGQI